MGSEETCEGCPFEGECIKSKKHQKVLSRDVVLEEMYGKVDGHILYPSSVVPQFIVFNIFFLNFASFFLAYIVYFIRLSI